MNSSKCFLDISPGVSRKFLLKFPENRCQIAGNFLQEFIRNFFKSSYAISLELFANFSRDFHRNASRSSSRTRPEVHREHLQEYLGNLFNSSSESLQECIQEFSGYFCRSSFTNFHSRSQNFLENSRNLIPEFPSNYWRGF